MLSLSLAAVSAHPGAQINGRASFAIHAACGFMLGHEHRSKCAKMAGGRNASVVVNVTLRHRFADHGYRSAVAPSREADPSPCHRYVGETALFLNFGR